MEGVIETGEEAVWSLAEVARQCKVSLMTARKWPRGIRVGGQIVKLRCRVIGTRAKITPADLAQFQQDCHKAMFGEEPPEPVETPTQQQRRAKEAQRRVMEMFGDDPDAPPRPRKKRT